MKIGLVGLGRMGSAMAQRLRHEGFEVVGWDHDENATRAAAEHSVSIAAGAQAVAAGSEVVMSVITEDDGVRGLFAGDAGFLGADVAGKLFIEMSTLRPVTARELAPMVETRGARLIDSPVLGTIPSV